MEAHGGGVVRVSSVVQMRTVAAGAGGVAIAGFTEVVGTHVAEMVT